MCCNPKEPMVSAPTITGCGCGCGTPERQFRRVLSRAQELERLTAYREQLLRGAAEGEKQISTLSKDQGAGSGSQSPDED